MTVMLSRKDWENPRFRRGYLIFWGVIVLIVGVLLTHIIPTGTLEGCTVESLERSSSTTQIATSCGRIVSFNGASGGLRTGSTYDFQMRGVFVRHADGWTESGG